jgi:PAS domain S-box-containing protein
MNSQYKPFSSDNNAEVERLEMALEAAGVGTWELDPNTRTVRWCRRTKALYGFADENIGDVVDYAELLSLIHPDDQTMVDQAVNQALDGDIRAPYNVEYRVIGALDGQSRWLHCKGQSYFNEYGEPLRFLGIAQNVSPDVGIRINLRESEEQLRTLVGNTPDVITRWDKKLRLTFANAAYQGKTGMLNDTLLGKTIEEMGHPASISGPYLQSLKRVLESAQPQEHYNAFPTPGGEIFYHSRLVPEFDAEGKVQGILAIARDVTELKASEARFRTVIEQAPMAIGVLSGKDMIIEIGNEKIFEVWGKDKSVQSKPILEALPEIKNQVFLELLQNVYETGVPYFGYAALAKLVRNNVLDDVYFDFVYTPLRDKSGSVSAVMVLATEVTAQVMSLQKIEASEARFRSLIEEAPVATCLFVGRELKIEVANDKIIEYWGKDKSCIGKTLGEAVPELAGQPFLEILDQVFSTGQSYEGRSEPALLLINGILETHYFDYTLKPLKNTAGEVYAIIDMAVDVTREVITRKALEESEAKLRSVVASAPSGMVVFTGRDMIVELPNQPFLDIIGKDSGIVGKPLKEAMPELENQPFLKILDEVYTTGIGHQSKERTVAIIKNGVMTHNLYDFTYTPLFDSEGKVFAILDVSVDVTEAVRARQRLEESELFSRNIIDNSPVAKLVLIGDEMVVRTVNENMLEMLGKDESVLSKPIMDAFPELKGTTLLQRLRHVLESGESFYQPEERMDLLRFGEPYTGYYNYVYKALVNTSGERYGILVTATEVTAQVMTRQKVEEAEESLRDAVELAELGTWQLDPKSSELRYSDRLASWFGFDGYGVPLSELISIVDRKDQERVESSITNALDPAFSGDFAEEFVVTNQLTGQRRILQARGRAFFDQENQPYLMQGTAQDVTEQRLLQISLEQQIQERTEELEVSNQELAAINEEYMATNEELAQSNYLLTQSNQNLQQFAYIASHDLQEPLRKIQSFGNLLSSRYKADLGEGTHLIERMQTAANRMSVLIQDLLAFSRISSKQDSTGSVDLTEVVEDVRSDLELKIQETGATFIIDPLPVISGDESQIGQLFQNLISNALKFRNPDTTPLIKITATMIEAGMLPDEVKPARAAYGYHRIDVTDNGIGFDPKYAERIFQVFQRLHGRSEFAGTGIGLAICEKVASNHGGAITAASHPGQGATFSIYLPV